MKPFELLLLYNLLSFILLLFLMITCKKKIKRETTKDIILKIVSIAVVVIHYSSLYVDFFTNQGSAEIEANMILPIYPCNIIMWLLVITAFMKNKESNLYKMLAEFVFIGGTVCGLIGIIFNTNFLNNPDFFDYGILKGLISHSIMIFGTIYLFVFNYVKIDVVRTMKSIFCGLMFLVLCGLLVNIFFAVFDIPSVNAMYMIEPPFAELPFINFFSIGIASLIVSFIGLNIYDFFVNPHEERWIYKKIISRKVKK